MGFEGPYYKLKAGGRLRRARVIQEAYDVTSRGIGSLFDLTLPPRAVEGVIPDGGPSTPRGCCKAGTIDIGRYEAVCSRKVVFALGAGDLAGGCISA